jgi:uncharacterized membrane protein YdbT with pleckstrin-like domain
MEDENSHYEKAKRIAKNKVSFIRHFIIYIVVILVFAILNNIFSYRRQWWLIVALIWGIFVFLNFLNAYIFKGGGFKKLEEDLVKREIKRFEDNKDEK